jgi:hypothetical protein
VALKILNEVYSGMTNPNADMGTWDMQGAHDDIYNLNGDPAKPGVLQAMATRIDSHDPSLGALQATVDRDPHSGEITGFTFGNLQQESAYNKTLNAEMMQGQTLQQVQGAETHAIAIGAISEAGGEYDQGVMHLDARSPQP